MNKSSINKTINNNSDKNNITNSIRSLDHSKSDR